METKWKKRLKVFNTRQEGLQIANSTFGFTDWGYGLVTAYALGEATNKSFKMGVTKTSSSERHKSKKITDAQFVTQCYMLGCNERVMTSERITTGCDKGN